MCVFGAVHLRHSGCSKHGVIGVPELEGIELGRGEAPDYTVCLLTTDGISDQLDGVALQRIIARHVGSGAQPLAELITEQAKQAHSNSDDATCVAIVIERER